MNLYWTAFPGDRDDHRLRGRSYRSEHDILSVILQILEAFGGRPVRKTRLVQYSNLNTRSFSKYVNLMLEGGLVRETKNGYLITPRGRLALRLMNALNSMLSGRSGVEAEEASKALCRAARRRGIHCSRDSGLFHITLKHSEAKVGVYIEDCNDLDLVRTATAIMRSEIAGSTQRERVAVICIGDKAPPTERPVEAPAVNYYRLIDYTDEAELESLVARLLA